MRAIRLLCAALAALFFSTAPALADTQHEWDGVERIVVIGDLEGDYEKLADMLRTAGLIDAGNNWTGGHTHLVQLGDIPDRGPNTRMIMDLLMRLEPQAQRAGGYVHALIGNHEAMNVEGDLRYVHPGEYAAFADRGSARRQRQFYQRTMNYLRQNPPADGVPVFDDAYRQRWEEAHPLGYVEHRTAWAPNGVYGRWITRHDAVIRINDTLFLHGGLGPAFAAVPRRTMNDAVRDALRGEPSAAYPDIVTHQEGPLWYRGLSTNEEAAETPNLENVLSAQGVTRVIVGHSKVTATVLPRFNGRVLVADIGVPRSHSDPHAFALFENGAWWTVHRGQRVALTASTPAETCAYLARIAEIDNGSGPVASRAAACATSETATAAEAEIEAN